MARERRGSRASVPLGREGERLCRRLVIAPRESGRGGEDRGGADGSVYEGTPRQEAEMSFRAAGTVTPVFFAARSVRWFRLKKKIEIRDY